MIKMSAFEGCSNLADVTFPETLTSIDWYAFLNCPALTSVTIPAGVILLGGRSLGYLCDEEGNLSKMDDITIYGYEESAAQIYATENGFTFVSPVNENPFEDVKKTDFFYNAVLWAVKNGITGGTDETHFSPRNTVMRADAMVFFWAAKGRPEFTTTGKTFKDVKKNHWAYAAVMWAVENGITGGTNTEGTTFSPQRTCSRSEILQFLYAAMGKPGYTISNPYSDLKPKQWYYDGAIWAYENGLEKGEDGKFKAKTPCTRAYVVTYLYRFMTGNDLAQ